MTRGRRTRPAAWLADQVACPPRLEAGLPRWAPWANGHRVGSLPPTPSLRLRLSRWPYGRLEGSLTDRRLITAEDVVELIGMRTDFIYRLAREGRIPT
jgi:hypothetical protein